VRPKLDPRNPKKVRIKKDLQKKKWWRNSTGREKGGQQIKKLKKKKNIDQLGGMPRKKDEVGVKKVKKKVTKVENWRAPERFNRVEKHCDC